MKHIVHIIPTLNYGGAERLVVDLVNNFDKEKYKFSIITFFDELPLASEITNKNVKIYVVPKRGQISWHLFSDLKNKLQELKPDIVHTHLFGGDFWGRIVAKKLNLSVVTTEHNLNVDEGLIKNILRRLLKNKTDVFVACSDQVADYMRRVYKIKKDIKIIKNGIELDKFLDLVEPQFLTPLNLLVLGRLTKQKGHEILLKALAGLKDLDWKLNTVGEGEEKNNLTNLVESLDLADKVNFIDFQKDVSKIFYKSDLLLLPSLWEGLGVVVMEAMASGRLVVGSEVGGVPELVENKKTGLLIKTGDVEAWKKALEYCFENKPSCVELAQAGRKYAKNNFGIEKTVVDYGKIYLSLLK